MLKVLVQIYDVSMSKEKKLRWLLCNRIDVVTTRRTSSNLNVCYQTYSNKFWGVLLTYAKGSKGAMCCSIEGEQVRLPFEEALSEMPRRR